MSTWCSKHVEAWNKLIVKQILCIKFVNYKDKYTEMHGQQNIKPSHHIPPRYILILPSTHQVVCFLPVTYQNTACISLLPMPDTCAVHQILLPFITLMMSGKYTLWISLFCGLLQPPATASLLVPIFFSAPRSGKPSVFALPLTFKRPSN